MKPATKAGPTRNFHVPLSDELHQEIHNEAKRTGRPATVLVRDAVESWLREQRRAAVHEEIAAYAQRWAGSEVDLDEALEAASVDHLTKRRRAPR